MFGHEQKEYEETGIKNMYGYEVCLHRTDLISFITPIGYEYIVCRYNWFHVFLTIR